jgi:hypothetical protein
MNDPLLGGVPERRGGFSFFGRFANLRKEAFNEELDDEDLY